MSRRERRRHAQTRRMALGERRWPKFVGIAVVAMFVVLTAGVAVVALSASDSQPACACDGAPTSAGSTTAAPVPPAPAPEPAPAPAPSPSTAQPSPVAPPQAPRPAAVNAPQVDPQQVLPNADPALLDQLDGQLAQLAANATGPQGDAVAKARDAVAKLRGALERANNGGAVDPTAVQDAVTQFAAAVAEYGAAASGPAPLG